MAHPVRILRLNHVQLTIPKGMEDAARAFYCGTLGMSEIAKPDALKAGMRRFECRDPFGNRLEFLQIEPGR